MAKIPLTAHLRMMRHLPYWRWVLRSDIGVFRRLYMPIERFKRRLNPAFRDLPVNDRTELVIEGYPRSGNTFSAHAFQYAQGRKVSIANRCHAPAQIMEAVHRDIPCLLLIRKPVESAISSYVYINGKLTPEFLLHHYLKFYRTLEPLLKEVVVASFEQVKNDFGHVIFRLNSRYAKDYELFENTPENVNAVFESIDKFDREFRQADSISQRGVSRPVDARTALKQEATAVFEAPRLQALIQECEELYAHVVSHSQVAVTSY
ncbi:MAG: hypothetical protein AAF497_03455 [Planctomycetota bacterium]